jgi:hypothetical protein
MKLALASPRCINGKGISYHFGIHGFELLVLGQK